ncbi:unnamed protein product [Adineta steineri]|uniref:F-box domain-containing protein n=1 Tax=Adineta steineri TaxID=433720 RepID=A0A814CUT4_9BILA|nr:unnamed protein product [Adineta steineri]CAF3490103.1 unnamed protein product [Adineta steineri]
MLSSPINLINQLSYRQIQNELKRRRMDSNGKKNDIVKRLKVVYEKELKNQTTNLTNFYDLPNEIFRDIFDYLCPIDVINSFYGLNYRFNELIKTIPMKLKCNKLNKNEYKRVLKHIVPKIKLQLYSLELGVLSKTIHSFNSEISIDLFTQSYNFTQFVNLRCLSLTSPNLEQLKSLFQIIPNMLSLRSLRLLEHDYYGSQNETVCKLTLANNHRYSMKTNHHLSHLFIETSPPFKTLTLIQKYFTNKISFDCIQLNIRCALFFYPHSLTYIDCDGLSRLVSNMNYLKIDITVGTYSPAFDLIRRFPQIQHLSVRTISKAYADGHQWAELLAQMSNINKLDLNIYLDTYNSNQELQTFQTKFWLERQWNVECSKKHKNSSECKITYRSNQVR